MLASIQEGMCKKTRAMSAYLCFEKAEILLIISLSKTGKRELVNPVLCSFVNSCLTGFIFKGYAYSALET